MRTVKHFPQISLLTSLHGSRTPLCEIVPFFFSIFEWHKVQPGPESEAKQRMPLYATSSNSFLLILTE